MNAALAQLIDEGQPLVRKIATREPAKVIAIRADLSPRHVYNLREEIGQPELAWPNFILLAKQYPELRTKVLEWLEADNANGTDPIQLANELVKALQARQR